MRSLTSKLAIPCMLVAILASSLEASIDETASYETFDLASIEQKEGEKIEKFLKKTVPGLDVSYREVFDTIIAEGHRVYLKGGVIRDLVIDPDSEPNDVDFGFSCTQEELKTILTKNRWQYTSLPDYPVITIGDRDGAFLEGLPKRFTVATNENQLEFTVNNIFYSVNDRKFIMDYELGIKDLLDRRLRVLAKDWDKWLIGDSRHVYYKIFRFWKMVGKGYIYQSDFEEFIREKTLIALNEDGEFFREEIFAYFSSHFHAFDEVSAGARIIMGDDWYQKQIASIKDQLEAEYNFRNTEYDKFTYFKDEDDVTSMTSRIQ